MLKDRTHYSRLKKRFSITFILVALVPFFLISWSSSHFYQMSSLENTTRGLKGTVENRKEVINFFLTDQKNLLLQLIHLYSYEVFKDQGELERIFTAVAPSGIVDLGLIDASGQHVTYVGPYRQKLIDKNYKDADWFHEVMINGCHISDVFLGYREVPHFVVAVADPLKKWVLRATVNSEFFDGLLRNAQLGEKGDAFIVNREGKFQTASRLQVNTLNLKERTLLNYHEGTEVHQIDNFLYVTSWLKNGEWLLLVKLQTSSVLEVFYHARNIDFLSILAAALLIIVVATLTVNQMVNKIERADREKASLDSQMIQVEKMASLGRMAAGVAHEVNNPLQLITDQSGWIGDLLDEEDPGKIRHMDEYRQALAKIKAHVARASGVTHRLLGFSRKMEAKKAEAHINFLIEEVLSFLENEAAGHDITITTHLQKDIPAIMTDATQIQQVFLNILNNSIDAIGKKGAIEITTLVDGKGICITIADTGPGIKPGIAHHIFDPFFTTKEPGKGTGLGLSICYNIIQSLGGTIEVGNRQEGGAVFSIKLPITTGETS